MVLTLIVLALLLLTSLWTVITRGLVRAALGLAAVSIILTILMFMLGAGLAAVFELSVCAGLITVVFVSTITMTQPSSRGELEQKTSHRLRRYWYLPVIMLVAGAALAALKVDVPALAAAPAAEARQVLWGTRQTDIVGQVIVIFAGVLAVIVLFKERKK